MSIITQDALQVIVEQLSPTSRLNLAAIDQRFFDVATRWNDVKTIVFDDEDVTLAGPNFVYSYQNSMFLTKEVEAKNQTLYKTTSKETALKLCPSVKKLIIQTKLSDFDAIALDKHQSKVTKLYMSVENLSLVNFPHFSKLRTLHLVVNSTKDIKVVDMVDERVLEGAFPKSLTRVCLTGIFLTEKLLNHLAGLPNLVCLDLIGCLVDTRVAVKYVPIFEKFPVLDELSLPPSMFSFTTKTKTTIDYNLQSLKVTKLGIYMDQFDEDQFYSQCLRFLPKNLKYLVVFGNYLPLKTCKLLKTLKKITILFGPNTSLASCPQANLTNVKLISHLVRCPPYVQQEYNPNFHRNHDIPLGNMSWQFSLIEWRNTGPSREIHAFRRRLNVRDDEDAEFEGVRIAPLVINTRLQLLRENRLRSPEAFQVFDPVVPNIHIPAPPPLPRRHEIRTFGMARRLASRQRRRSEPIGGIRDASLPPVTPPPPAVTPPPVTATGTVLNRTIASISPIVATSTVTPTTLSRVGGTSTTNSELNRAFVGTPRRDSTASTVSTAPTAMNSELTATPERVAPPPPPPPPTEE